MARSVTLLGTEIDEFASLNLPLWQRGRGDFKIDFLSSKLHLFMWERHLAATGSRLEAAPTEKQPKSNQLPWKPDVA